MTLDELKAYEDDVASHRQLPKEALDELFAIARSTLETPAEVEAPVAPATKRKKGGE